uniref:OTU domain-containing protein n=1 Tax=Dunaliella tertiolecta TaxID=3047 RepID=A0A7S3R4G7_DUNTE
MVGTWRGGGLHATPVSQLYFRALHVFMADDLRTTYRLISCICNCRWGGEPELVMAVNVIRRPITVHHIVDGAATPIVTYGEELGMAQAVHLLWSTVHYDLLIPE